MGEMELERLLVRSKEINSTSTYRNSKYYQKYLTDFLASQGKSDINLAEITEEFGNSYKAFLKRYKNFGPSQMNKCLCWLSKLVYLAVDYEILRANPLEDMEYEKKPAPRHKHISRAELKTILETPMPDPCRNLGGGRSCSRFYGTGIRGHHAAPSAPYWHDIGRQALYPYQPQENQCGGIHPPAPDSRTDT